MNWNMTKEEIINAGLIALCYGGEDIIAYTDAEHIKDIPLFNHWYTGEAFTADFDKIWCVQVSVEGGITGYNSI